MAPSLLPGWMPAPRPVESGQPGSVWKGRNSPLLGPAQAAWGCPGPGWGLMPPNQQVLRTRYFLLRVCTELRAGCLLGRHPALSAGNAIPDEMSQARDTCHLPQLP